MKKYLLSLAAAAAAFAILAPLAATLSAAEVNCRVPFSFVVAGKTLPPGGYSLETRGAVLMIRGVGSSAIVLTNGTHSYDATGAKLVFLKTGERYDLAEVWTSDGDGRQLVSARTRRYLEDRARAANAPLERIVIAVH